MLTIKHTMLRVTLVAMVRKKTKVADLKNDTTFLIDMLLNP